MDASGWRGIIQRNLTSLTDCTVVTSEMAAQLINFRLINRSEEHSLMNSTISDHERALILYMKIARKWNSEGFKNFIVVLAEGLNTRALEILKSEHNKALSDPSFVHHFQDQNESDDSHIQRFIITESDAVLGSYESVSGMRAAEMDLKEKQMVIQAINVHLREEMTLIAENLYADITTKFNQIRNGSLLDIQEDITFLKSKMEIFQEKVEELQAMEMNKRLRLEKLEEAPRFKIQLSSEISTRVFSAQGSSTGHQNSSEEDIMENLIQTESVIMMLDEQTLSTIEQFQPQYQRRLRGEEKVLHVSPETAPVGNKTIWRLGCETPFEMTRVMGVWYWIEQFEENPLDIVEWNRTSTFTMDGETITCKNRRINSDEDELTTTYSVNSLSPHYWTINIRFKILAVYWLLRFLGGNLERLWMTTDYDNWAILSWCSSEKSSKRSLFILSRTSSLPEKTLRLYGDFARESHPKK